MTLIHSLLIIILFCLSMFISLFLSLIAKYYHQKSSGGPKPVYFFVYTVIFSLGQIFRLSFFEELLGSSISALCLLIGGTGIISASVVLYKSMMSIEKG